MKVGFIGLGSLGGPIARRIAHCGFPLGVYDIAPAAMADFPDNVVRAADPIAAARFADVLAVCVRVDAELEDIAADGALFAALGEGNVFVIHSTVAPDLCRRLAAIAAPHGVAVVDAGVSGGAPAAEHGGLSIWAGGDDGAIERARPVLATLGTINHVGPVGRGMEGKLLNNLVSIANYGMSAAILDLGEELGFERAMLRDALMAGSAQSFALRAVPGLLRPEGAGAMRQLLGKDLAHARALADERGVAMAALVAAGEALLRRLERAATETA